MVDAELMGDGGVVLDGTEVPRAQLLEASRRAATGLASMDVGPGDSVAVLLRNDILVDSGAKVLVVHTDLQEEARPVVPEGVAVLVAPTPPGAASAVHARAGRGPSRDQRAGARHRAPDADLIPAPMYHSFGNAYAVGALLVRAQVVLQPRFDPEQLLGLIEAHRITRLFMVPTMFVRLLQLDADVRDRYDLSSLEHVVHSAARCPPEAKRAMIDWWGPIITDSTARPRAARPPPAPARSGWPSRARSAAQWRAARWSYSGPTSDRCRRADR